MVKFKFIRCPRSSPTLFRNAIRFSWRKAGRSDLLYRHNDLGGAEHGGRSSRAAGPGLAGWGKFHRYRGALLATRLCSVAIIIGQMRTHQPTVALQIQCLQAPPPAGRPKQLLEGGWLRAVLLVEPRSFWRRRWAPPCFLSLLHTTQPALMTLAPPPSPA